MNLPTAFPRLLTRATVTPGTYPGTTGVLAPRQARRASTVDKKEKLVVLGGGWAGYTFLRKLDQSKYDITGISSSTTFACTPLLPSATTGALSFRDIVEPLQTTSTVSYYHAWANSIDFDRKVVKCIPAARPVFRAKDPMVKVQQRDARAERVDPEKEKMGELVDKMYEIKYDKLVIATGCYNQTFNIEGVKENAYFLRDIESASAIRYQIYEIMDAAKWPQLSETTREALLTWVVVGGGPTGTELSAELHDLARSREFTRLYPTLAPRIRIKLIDAAPDILASFGNGLKEHAKRKFKRDGIEVLTSRTIEKVGPTSLHTKEDGEIGTGLIVWSTGNKASPLNESLEGVLKDKRKSLVVTPGLQLLASPVQDGADPVPIDGVYAMGDCASIQENALPATAQVANQQALFLANALSDKLKTPEQRKFKYNHRGSMTSIGGNQGLIETPFGNQAGRLAWLAWRSYYWMSTVSIRTKVNILTRWTWNAVLGRDTSRL